MSDLRLIFVGGPGRSGTSVVASRLGQHPQICAFPDVELKLLTEKSGLLDLNLSLVRHYSPNRASVSLQQFRHLLGVLLEGGFGQKPLSDLVSAPEWQRIVARFEKSLLRDGHPVRLDQAEFIGTAQRLLHDIATLCRDHMADPERTRRFLEKTPHALLEMEFLHQLSPSASFVHVMRDPRSIAYSLRRMRWAPDRLEACCAWVDSYLAAFLSAQCEAASAGRIVHAVRIEAVARDPMFWSSQVCRWLDLDTVPDLFDGVSMAALNDWAGQCPSDARDLLDARLGGWAHHFGYAARTIGLCGAYPEAA